MNRIRQHIIEWISYKQRRLLREQSQINTNNIKREYSDNIGEGLVINGFLHLKCDGELSVGNNVTINSGALYNSAAGDGETYITVRAGAKLVIGNNVGISNCAITVANMVDICDDVAIGTGTVIADTDFHPLFLQDRLENNEQKTKTEPIFIGRGVFIGARSIILKGVSIGDNSIVGAGSVVASNIPSNEIWAGNPARFISKV